MGKTRQTGNQVSNNQITVDITNQRVGIASTSPNTTLDVVGNILVSGISTINTVQISSGIITATTGIVTYYGDGSKLSGVSASGSGGTYGGYIGVDLLESFLFS